MTLTIMACLALTLAVWGWVFSAAPEAEQATARQIRAQALRERKQAVYENLKDLHFEHLAGKLSQSDFERSRLMLEQEAATVAGELKQVGG